MNTASPILVTVEGIVNSVRAVPEKAVFSIFVMPSGKTTDLKFSLKQNILDGTVFIFFERTADVIEWQLEKAFGPTVVTLSGKVMDFNAEHSENAQNSIVFRFGGSVMLFNARRLLKPYSRMVIRESGSDTDVQYLHQ